MGSISNSNDGESGVDNAMAEFFVKGMHILETQNREKSINVIMNNPGGDWYHGMAIYDAILNSPCPCVIKVYGYAMSMGSVILQAASKRIMMPNSRFMIHYGYSGIYSHTKIVEKWSDENKRLNYEMENIYLDKMTQVSSLKLGKALSAIINKQRSSEIPYPGEVSYTFSREKKQKREELRAILREMLNFDTILSPEETISIGLADEVFQK
jgi:ATP-dependent Clp endopeptidase proteolytic subunit ClpP